MNDWVIESKLHPPPASAHFVRRERLLSRLNSCTRPGVCVVHAAAGCGKTAALAHWHEALANDTVPVAWISLDERDQTLASFFTLCRSRMSLCSRSRILSTSSARTMTL